MIRFENICKTYKSRTVIKNVNFTIEKGEIVTIIGESGCGKTTLLKMINRLIKPTKGEILIDGKRVSEMDIIELRRNTGYVIQQTGLFPHLTIRENIEMIPKLQSNDNQKIEAETIRLMEIVGLDAKMYLDRYPTELSGGQQQRVGVARAFAIDPDIILMDEPFSALDPMTREDLQDELIEIQSKFHKTIVFVTHDMDEAVKIADKICIMKDGEILQYDTPENILRNPADDYVSSFVGKNRIWASPEFIKVEDIMIEKPHTTTKKSSILKCIEKMRHNKVDSLIVIKPETREFQGILKAKQARRVQDKSKLAEEVMLNNMSKLRPQDSILDALKIVNEEHTSTVPIVDENNILQGMVTRSSLVTTLSEQYIEVEGEE